MEKELDDKFSVLFGSLFTILIYILIGKPMNESFREISSDWWFTPWIFLWIFSSAIFGVMIQASRIWNNLAYKK